MIKLTSRFKKDYKTIVKRGYDVSLLETVIDDLAHRRTLPEKCRDHSLGGDYRGFRECHIQPDWLLIYLVDDDVLTLTLTRTGTHSDLFDL